MSLSGATEEAFALRNEEGRHSWFLGSLLTWKATGTQTHDHWEFAEQRGRRGFAAPFHIHHRETEGFYVLEGELTFHLGEREIPAKSGTFAMIPPGTRHAFVVESPEARFLLIISPAGLVKFFDQLAESTESSTLPPLDFPMADQPALEEAAKRFGMTILGPPPAPRLPR
jgi:mannose-6-phosphate isomerase-like protein (cupin superfamily)